MAKQTLLIGSAPNDGTGDTLRAAGEKINENFDEVYSAAVDLLSGQARTITFVGTPNAQVTGTTAVTTLATIAIPAGLMGVYGQAEIIATFGASGVAGTKTVQTLFGGVLIQQYAVANTNLSIRTFAQIANNNNESSQLAPHNGVGSFGFGGATGAPIVPTVNTANAFDITIRGTLANAADILTLQSYIVRIHRRLV